MSATGLKPGLSAVGDMATAANERSVLRVDTFDCPAEHAGIFEDRLMVIHSYFDTLEGCLYNRIAARSGDDDARVRFVTLVEWRDRQALAEAKAAVAAFYAQSGFDPASFMKAHGITGDFGTFLPVGQ